MSWFLGEVVQAHVRTSRGHLGGRFRLEAGVDEVFARDGVELRVRVGAAGQGRLVVDASVVNRGRRPVSVQSVVPLEAIRRGGTWLARAYRQGWQSWSPALSLSFRQHDVPSRPPVEAPAESARPLRRPGELRSDEVLAVIDETGRSSLLGFISARRFVTQVRVRRHTGAPQGGSRVEAVCATDGVALAPGEALAAERLVVDEAGETNDQLERYAVAMAREMGARTPRRAPSGWCSWYYYFTNVTEADVLENLRFLAERRRDLPVDYVQIDDGYQSEIGDWLTTNEKFPHGMKWLAREIRGRGFRPGIWLAPFLLGERSRTYAEHPDWVIRDASGEPVVAMHNWGQRTFGLDGSRPETVAWVRDLFREVAEGWGYDYVKVDFLYGAALAGRRADARVARVEAYRRLLSAVREGVGPRRFVLGCGALMGASAGIVDGMRIGPDVAPWWRFQTKEEREGSAPRRPSSAQPRVGGQPAAEAALRNTLTRAWMHGRLWVNDPDCLLVREDRTKLTLDEVRTLATVIALSGGMTLSSDRLPAVPEERLVLLSMALPPLPHGGRTRDLMERSLPCYFEWRGRSAGGPAWLIVGINWDDRPRAVSVQLPDGQWTAFEFWTQRVYASAEGTLRFPRVPAHGCRFIALRPPAGRPQFVGSTLHFGQGTRELLWEDWEFDTLRLRLRPVVRSSGEIFIAVPPGFRARWVRAGRRRGSFWQRKGLLAVSVKFDRLMTVRVRFERVSVRAAGGLEPRSP